MATRAGVATPDSSAPQHSRFGSHPEFVGVPISLICSGSGEHLARVVASHPPVQPERVVSLTGKLGAALSECAPAYAVAVLAAEGAEA